MLPAWWKFWLCFINPCSIFNPKSLQSWKETSSCPICTMVWTLSKSQKLCASQWRYMVLHITVLKSKVKVKFRGRDLAERNMSLGTSSQKHTGNSQRTSKLIWSEFQYQVPPLSNRVGLTALVLVSPFLRYIKYWVEELKKRGQSIGSRTWSHSKQSLCRC